MSFELRNKTVYIISPESWGSNLVSKHHYAIELSKQGNKVFFINPPNADSNHEAAENISIINPPSSKKGLRFLPKPLARAAMRKEVEHIVELAGKNPDVVWSFDNSRLFHLDLFGAQFAICHIVDDNMRFQIETHASTADLCLGVTHQIVNRLLKSNQNAHFLQHGLASISDFEDSTDRTNSRKVATYAGNLLIPYIDWILVEKLVDQNQEVLFRFVGSKDVDNLNREAPKEALMRIEELDQLDNTDFTGAVSQERYRKYIAESDILLLFYNHLQFPDQVANSHKILEYLSTGNPIVSNSTSVYEQLDLLEMADNHEEYLNLFRKVKNHPEVYCAEQKVLTRKNYAADHTYSKNLTRIESLLAEHE